MHQEECSKLAHAVRSALEVEKAEWEMEEHKQQRKSAEELAKQQTDRHTQEEHAHNAERTDIRHELLLC